MNECNQCGTVVREESDGICPVCDCATSWTPPVQNEDRVWQENAKLFGIGVHRDKGFDKASDIFQGSV